MGHHDQDPGHGEPGHVHNETWNRNMMATDDPETTDDTAHENEEAGREALGAGAGALGGAGLGDQAEEETEEDPGTADYVDPRNI